MKLNQLWKQILTICLVVMTSAAFAQTVNVTIQADMTNEMGTFTTIHAPGAHNGWDANGAQMTDPDLDNVYEIVVAVPVGIQQTFKFAEDSGTTWENVPASCGLDDGFGGNNRYFTAYNDTVLPAACWSACGSCASVCDVNVTFQVNMSNEADTLGGAHIAGSFNGWTPTAMTSMGGGVYEATYTMTGTEHYAFKYLNGSDWANAESVPMACGEDNGFGDYNRIVDPSCTDTTVGLVCFSDCNDCAATVCDIANVPSGLSSNVGATSTTLSWTTTPLSVGCNIKATRITPPGPSPSHNELGFEVSSVSPPNTIFGAGTTWEWKVRCACTITPAITATAFSGNNTFSIPVARIADASVTEVNLFPNPASNSVNVQFNNESSGQLNIEVIDMLGRVLYSDQMTVDAGNQQIELNVADYSEGVYFLRISAENYNISEQFTVSH